MTLPHRTHRDSRVFTRLLAVVALGAISVLTLSCGGTSTTGPSRADAAAISDAGRIDAGGPSDVVSARDQGLDASDRSTPDAGVDPGSDPGQATDQRGGPDGPFDTGHRDIGLDDLPDTGHLDAAIRDGGAPDATAGVPPPLVIPEDFPAVGFIDTKVPGPDGLIMPLAIWYPANTVPKSATRANYLGIESTSAWVKIPAAPGSHPVILFSHGNQGTRLQSITITEAWARAGYIVAAPDHVGNTFLDQPTNQDLAIVALRRPDDMGAALDAVRAMDADPESILSGIVDLDRIGMSGHSFGGWTTLLVAGGAVDVALLRAGCQSGQVPSFLCPVIDNLSGDFARIRPDSLRGVMAAVAFAPAGRVAFGTKGLAQATAPTLVMVGSSDTTTPALTEGRPIFDALPSPKAFALLDRANHFSFSDLCNIPGIASIAPGVAATCDPVLFLDPDTALMIAAALSTAWFDVHVRGAAVRATDLSQQAVDDTWPGIVEIDRAP